MNAMEKLLAAALMGSVMGAAGCASTTAQSEPTTPGAEKAACNGKASCKGEAGSCKGHASCKGEGGEKASCKGQHGCSGEGQPGEAAGGVAPQ
jgi:hypothetical protein